MSHFLKILQRHQAELDRMIEQHEEGRPITYSMMRDMGMLKPFAVRLPVPLIAVLDEMVGHGLWHSKQEMVCEMIQSAFADFLESSSESTKAVFLDVQKKAWDSWEKKHKDKVFNSKTGKYEPREQRVKPKQGKQRDK